MTQPLTNEQIWGLPEEQMPEPELKDYFGLEDDEKTVSPQVCPGGQEVTDDEATQTV